MTQKSQSPHSVDLPSDLTIRNISQVKTLLESAFQSGGAVVVNVPANAQLDASFIQLMEAARCHAARNGARLTISPGANAAVLEVIKRSGLQVDREGEVRNFWLEGKDAA